MSCAKFGLKGEFAYYPANGWPHKNHEAVVRAMVLVVRERPDLQLVLTGWPYDLDRRLNPIIDEMDLRRSVRHLGYVSRAEVAGLMAASQMLVFPSLFEGFGLPLLEAMHLGTPVVCSTVGSLPEVGGEAARFFDARSEERIAEAIVEVAGDAALRRRLIDAGRDQVARFSYARTAARTLEVFEQVHQGKLPRPEARSFRPLNAALALDQGHARWYFRLADLRSLRMRLRNTGPTTAISRQEAAVFLNGERLFHVGLSDAEEREVVAAITGRTGAFRMLEVRAAPRASRVRRDPGGS